MKNVSALLVVVLTLATLVSGEEPDKRFLWSSEKFAAECNVDWSSYLASSRTWFSDHNYSNRWSKSQPEALKSCADCYQIGDIAELPTGKWIARLSLSSESGDWFHEITYCFDSSGRLRGVLSIFNYNWSYIRVYSVQNGVPKLQVSRWQELITGKETTRPDTADDFKRQWSYMPVYKSFSQVPFSRLEEK